MENKPQAYIEILGAVAKSWRELNKAALCSIGEFTRDNISNWMEHQRNPNWFGLLPVEDFHAVCGDIDIPWAKEESMVCYSAKLPWWKD